MMASENQGSWRVNKALFQKPNKESKEWNDNGELSNNIRWEASKTVIRGELIQYWFQGEKKDWGRWIIRKENGNTGGIIEA